jgi:hypothetical protein
MPEKIALRMDQLGGSRPSLRQRGQITVGNDGILVGTVAIQLVDYVSIPALTFGEDLDLDELRGETD